MKVNACVVWYNPNQENLNNIKLYPKFLNKLYIIDNSNISNKNMLQNINLDYDYEYIPLLENKGIAYALKLACDIALKEECDYILTMDQDSIFPINNDEYIFNTLSNSKFFDEYAIIGIGYEKIESTLEIIDVKEIITSGNFLNLHKYRLTQGFNVDLFIDYVDFDICQKFNAQNFKIGFLTKVHMQHKIGNPINKNILGVKFSCMNHSPIRYYYRFRNSRYLYKTNKKYYRRKYYKEIIIDVLKVILFEPNKRKKMKMIKKGRYDAKRNILGKYKEEKYE